MLDGFPGGSSAASTGAKYVGAPVESSAVIRRTSCQIAATAVNFGYILGSLSPRRVHSSGHQNWNDERQTSESLHRTRFNQTNTLQM